jgi:hypothetical protein
MKKLVQWLFVLMCMLQVAAAAFGQSGSTTIVANHIQYFGGTTITGKFCLTPTDASGNPITIVTSLGQQVAPQQPLCFPITAGVLSSAVVPDTSMVQPVNACYNLTISNFYGAQVADFPCIQPSTNTWSFDTYVPSSTPTIPALALPQFQVNGTAIPNQAVLNFVGSNISLSGSNLALTASLPSVGANTIIGNNTGSTAIAAPLTASQVHALLGGPFTFFTVGTGGVTANHIVSFDGSGNAIASTGTGFGGLAASTVAAAGTVEVLRLGVGTCVFDGAAVVGDIAIPSTTTPGECHDSGLTSTQSVPSTTSVIGPVETAASGVGATGTVRLHGPGSFGAQVVLPSIATATVLGNNSGSTAAASALSQSQLHSLLGGPYTFFTVGTGGVTANTIVSFDASGNAIASTGTGFGGLAASTVAAAGTVEVIRAGIGTCLFDAAAVVGDIAIPSTTTPGECHDSGVTSSQSLLSTVTIVGPIESAAASAGATGTVRLHGPGAFGAAGPLPLAGTGAAITTGPTSATAADFTYFGSDGHIIDSGTPSHAVSATGFHTSNASSSCTVASVAYTTQGDCAAYTAYHLASTSGISQTLYMDPGVTQTCAGWNFPPLSNNAAFSIIGPGEAKGSQYGYAAQLEAVCSLGTSPVLNYTASSSQAMEGVTVTGFAINANNETPNCAAFGSLPHSAISWLSCNNASYGGGAGTYGFRFGNSTTGGSAWLYETPVSHLEVYAPYGPSGCKPYTPCGGGSAQVTVSGGVPTGVYTILTAGSNYLGTASEYSVLFTGSGSGVTQNQGVPAPCSTMPTGTVNSFTSGALTTSSVTITGGSGCDPSNTFFIVVPTPTMDTPFWFDYFSDTTASDLAVNGPSITADFLISGTSGGFVLQSPHGYDGDYVMIKNTRKGISIVDPMCDGPEQVCIANTNTGQSLSVRGGYRIYQTYYPGESDFYDATTNAANTWGPINGCQQQSTAAGYNPFTTTLGPLGSSGIFWSYDIPLLQSCATSTLNTYINTQPPITTPQITLPGSTSGSATISVSATGGTLNLGSANATVNAAGALSVTGCTGCSLQVPTVAAAAGDLACAVAADTTIGAETITAGSTTGTVATLTAATVPNFYYVGQKIGVTGATPSGLNGGPYTITAVTNGTSGTVSFANSSGVWTSGGTFFLWCANQTNNAVSATQYTFANGYSLGASYFTSSDLLSASSQVSFFTSSSAVSPTFELYLGSNALYLQAGTATMTNSITGNGGSYNWSIAGISSTLVNADLTSLAIQSSSTPNTFVNSLVNPRAVTTGAQTLAPRVYFSAATAGNAILQRSFTVRTY